MEIFGYIAAILIGITLGLIGGGGSILTVPVLVYLFQIQPELAATYSLFIVGTTSIIGAIGYIKQKSIDYKAVVYFGTASIISVWLTRQFLLPKLPQELLQLGNWILTKQFALMALFAILMLAASYKMIYPNKGQKVSSKPKKSAIIIQGLLVGMVTGLLGAGGGFLIIPALTKMLHLDIKKAIGTSLVIIAINSLIGFSTSISTSIINWNFLLLLTGLSIVGITIGTIISKKISGSKLKPAFGWFVLIMGIYILLKEIS